jgi:hypothetical protein
MPKHRADVRDALIRLFKEPVPESYKAGRMVLQSILGHDDLPLDRPILDFNTNPLLTALVRPGVTPIVWETKPRLSQGGKTVLEPLEGAGAELLMEFLGTSVHTRIYSVHTLNLSYILVHTSTNQYILVHTYQFLYILVHTRTYI